MPLTIHRVLSERLHAQAGILPPLRHTVNLSLDKLQLTQWSPEFESLMRNRMILGALRYGLLGAPGKPPHDNTPSAIRRIRKYQLTGNLEHLVDAANLCLCEYVEGRHPLRHFTASDDGEHTKELPK